MDYIATLKHSSAKLLSLKTSPKTATFTLIPYHHAFLHLSNFNFVRAKIHYARENLFNQVQLALTLPLID